MAKTKVKSGPGVQFPKGGSGHMSGKNAAGPQAAGVEANKRTGNGGKFPMGGRGHMVGKQSAGPAKKI